MPVKTIGIFGNPGKPDLPDAIRRVRSLCDRSGVEVLLSAELAALVPELSAARDDEELGARVDVLIVFGGDGSMLRAARTLDPAETPVLGINLGSLGYLTDVPLTELDEAVDLLLAGDFTAAPRLRVGCEVRRDGKVVARVRALNDIVVNMGPTPRALDMEVRINSASLGRFLGDGLIVSTPTGSTAYNLSAGGPIVHPGVAGMIVTPICPHSLAIRPLIVPMDSTVKLHLHRAGASASLTADGQANYSLSEGDRVHFRVADGVVNLVKFPRSDYFRVVRRKLQWGAIKRRRNRD